MMLFTVSIQSSAVITKSIASVSRSSFKLWNVATRWTCAIVVMDAMCSGFRYFVDGIKSCRCWHLVFSFEKWIKGSYSVCKDDSHRFRVAARFGEYLGLKHTSRCYDKHVLRLVSHSHLRNGMQQLWTFGPPSRISYVGTLYHGKES
jgi:hypothetical protein